MDDVVKQAMAKWPNVPAVYGWLELDRRGRWLIKGERISNPVITAFIGRNYGRDAPGCWYFQNGPQRVFVSLASTPLVYRLEHGTDTAAPARILTHNDNEVTRVDRAWLDEEGMLLLETEHGPGMVDDRDLDRLLPCFCDARGTALSEDAIEAAIERLQKGSDADLWLRYRSSNARVSFIHSAEAPARLGFIRQPVQPAGQEQC